MADLLIERENATTIRIYSEDDGIHEELYELFRYEEETFFKNKNNKWDGIVRLYNKRNGRVPYGLLHRILDLAKQRDWVVELDDRFKEDLYKITNEELQEWVNTLDIHDEDGKTIDLYDYQFEALYKAIVYGRMVELLATSAGKSLLIATLVRFYSEFQMNPNETKILIVVPSVMLVNQLSNDIKTYFSTTWDSEQYIHKIFEGQDKFTHKPVIITTYQSMIDMVKENPKFFEQFSHVINDECHGSTGTIISSIMNLCVNGYKRIGLTGTLKTDKLSPILIESLFGPVKRLVKTKELQDAGRAAQTKVTMMMLEYPLEDRHSASLMNYQEEIDFLINNKFRNKVIKSLAKTLEGNSLIIFERVDSHLVKIVNELNEEGSIDKEYYVITGKVKGEEREVIKRLTEKNSGIVIFATWGCMSTGVSINRLHNLVFAHPSKSIIRVLQSLGRTLRLHITKSIANIYDIVDDLRYNNKENYAFDHAIKRYGYYTSEEHNVVIKKYTVKN